MFKPIPHLYRDCLRTVLHMTGRSAKGRAITAIIRQEFKANKDVTDQAEIDKLRSNTTNALANYLAMQSLGGLKHVKGDSAHIGLGGQEEEEEDADVVVVDEDGNPMTEEEVLARHQQMLEEPDSDEDSAHHEQQRQPPPSAETGSAPQSSRM